MRGGRKVLHIEKLYMQYGQDVYRYLLSLTRDPLLSEDLLSETFLAVITSLPSFQGESSVKTWLFSIARHKWLQQLRSNGRKGEGGALSYEQLEDFLADWYLSEDPSKHLTDAEACGRLRQLLDAEEERTRQVVSLRIAGHSFAAIGRRLGISEGSARVIDFRAKKKIQSILKKEGLYDG